MSIYVHYWYDHYHTKKKPNHQLIQTKEQIFKGHISSFQKRKNKMVISSSGFAAINMDDWFKILTDDSSGLRKQVFEAEMENNSLSSQVIAQGKTAGALGKSGTVSPGQLASEIEAFISRLDQLMEEAYASLTSGGSFKAFKQSVFSEYASKNGKVKNKSESEVKKSIVEDLLVSKNDTFKKIDFSPTGDKAMDTSLKKLAALSEALPEIAAQAVGMKYKTGKNKPKKIETEDKALQIIAGKVSGLFNNIVGAGAEIAWEQAEIAGKKEIEQAIEKYNAAIAKAGVSVTTSTVGANRIDKGDGGKKVSKPDVNVSVNGAGVRIEYGVTVKNYKIKNGQKSVSIKLSDKENFYTTLSKMFKTTEEKEYLYNLAAGLSVSPRDGKGGKSHPELEGVFQEVLSTVGLIHFLEALAGTAKNNQDNILYMVLNGKIITIEEILESVCAGGSSVSTVIKSGSGSGTTRLSRTAFEKINRNNWEIRKGSLDKNIKTRRTYKFRDTSAGKIRSERTVGEIEAILRNYKMNITLNMLTSLLNK